VVQSFPSSLDELQGILYVSVYFMYSNLTSEAAPSYIEYATEAPGSIIGFCSVVINEYLAVTTIAE
jgi:hypothetical protein